MAGIFGEFYGVSISHREEHSMDQCWSRLKLSENFERHWSIRISGKIHMDQSLVHTFSWGHSYGPMVLKFLNSKVSPYTGIGPWMALPSPTRKQSTKDPQKKSGKSGAFFRAKFGSKVRKVRGGGGLFVLHLFWPTQRIF